MGVSNDAQLVFGFTFEEEYKPEFLGDFDDLDEYLTDNIPYKEKQAIIEACPVELVTHCSHDYPMYILAIRNTIITAYRGEAKEITPEQLIIASEKIAAFKMWCEENNIEYKEPKWLLCSMNG